MGVVHSDASLREARSSGENLHDCCLQSNGLGMNDENRIRCCYGRLLVLDVNWFLHESQGRVATGCDAQVQVQDGIVGKD